MLNHKDPQTKQITNNKSEHAEIAQQHSPSSQIQKSSIQQYNDPQNIKQKASKHPSNQQHIQLTNIFIDLITLVNKHSQVLQHIPIVNSSNIGMSSSHQQSSRMMHKKRRIKPRKFFQQQQQHIKQPLKTKTRQIKKQIVQIKYNPLKKPFFQSKVANNKYHQQQSIAHQIFSSYNLIMDYKFHYNDDVEHMPCQQNQNVKFVEPIFSDSFANSSKNMDEKQRQRKFSIEQCVQVNIRKPKPNFKIYKLPVIQIKKEESEKSQLQQKQQTIEKLQEKQC